MLLSRLDAIVASEVPRAQGTRARKPKAKGKDIKECYERRARCRAGTSASQLPGAPPQWDMKTGSVASARIWLVMPPKIIWRNRLWV